jgi:hypothetical protein
MCRSDGLLKMKSKMKNHYCDGAERDHLTIQDTPWRPSSNGARDSLASVHSLDGARITAAIQHEGRTQAR